jgi:hypothetical protein
MQTVYSVQPIGLIKITVIYLKCMIKIFEERETHAIVSDHMVFDEYREFTKRIKFLGITIWKKHTSHEFQYSKSTIRPKQMGFVNTQDENEKKNEAEK